MRDGYRVQGPTPCRGRGDLFLTPSSETKRARTVREAEAKALCGACPQQEACLTDALEHGEREDVWGGLNPDERRELVRLIRAAS